MKKFVLISFLMLVSCGDKIPDGEYRLLDFKDEHFDPTEEYNIPQQYFTFDGLIFDHYVIEDGERVYYQGEKSIINYNYSDNSFSYKINDTTVESGIFEWKYFLNKDTLILKNEMNKPSPTPNIPNKITTSFLLGLVLLNGISGGSKIIT